MGGSARGGKRRGELSGGGVSGHRIILGVKNPWVNFPGVKNPGVNFPGVNNPGVNNPRSQKKLTLEVCLNGAAHGRKIAGISGG